MFVQQTTTEIFPECILKTLHSVKVCKKSDSLVKNENLTFVYVAVLLKGFPEET